MITEVLEGLGGFAPLVDLGATGALFVLVWRLMVKKDKKSYEMLEQLNKERKEMYESQRELVREATKALVDKNNTDEKMSAALMKLASELRDLRESLNDSRFNG